MDDKEVPVIDCHHCGGGERTTECWHCNNTGRLFWIGGYAFPYTPEGEMRAKKVADAMAHNQFIK
jgi:hypothetical protein